MREPREEREGKKEKRPRGTGAATDQLLNSRPQGRYGQSQPGAVLSSCLARGHRSLAFRLVLLCGRRGWVGRES